MKKQNLSQRQNRERKPRRTGYEQVPNHLPQLTDQLQTGIVLRYTTTGTGGSASTTVTFTNLLDSWCVATSATAAYQLFDFVRIKRVTIRAVSNPAVQGISALGAIATVGIEYPGLVVGTQAGGRQASDSTVGTAYMACCSLAPDPKSSAAMWQASSSNVAFVLRAVDFNGGVIIGAVIDVELAFKNSADVNPAAVTSAVAGATTGALYFRGIDGAAPAATWARSVFIPRI